MKPSFIQHNSILPLKSETTPKNTFHNKNVWNNFTQDLGHH